jgi:hypothetical protein
MSMRTSERQLASNTGIPKPKIFCHQPNYWEKYLLNFQRFVIMTHAVMYNTKNLYFLTTQCICVFYIAEFVNIISPKT